MIDWLNESLRTALEQAVSEYVKRRWRVVHSTDLADLASHPAALFSDGAYAVFVKLSDAPNGLEQFDLELAGLRFLADRTGVLTPVPIGALSIAGESVLILEAVQVVERTADHWRQIGQTLARIHQIKGTQFGFETDNYFGPLRQDNSPMTDWAAFYAERRLQPLLKMAVDLNYLPRDAAHLVERLIARLPDLCGPPITPTLLHGDAQQNNFISAAAGTYVIDPAVYYGHPEVDLALVDYFQPVPDAVFDAYGELLPIDPGFAERRELWRIHGYLAHVVVGGPHYAPKLIAAVQSYL